MRLRPATPEDAERLWAWRTDPDTVAFSFLQHTPSWSEHFRWLQMVLNDRRRHLFIAEEDGHPVGTLRLDEDSTLMAEVSLTVAPEYRDRGCTGAILRLALQEAKDRGIKVLTARIKATNVRSLRAFLGAGFTPRFDPVTLSVEIR